tara:strand:+ start:588 stop:923 length:336 start_codon:yes stop_codon:yes gene_type:complete
MAEIDFYNPTDAGTTVLGVTQINKMMKFKSLNGVYITEPFVKVYNCEKLVKTYTFTDGLVLEGVNVAGTEKILTLTLNGTDFVNDKGRTLNAKCSFFVDGDIEIVFNISVK